MKTSLETALEKLKSNPNVQLINDSYVSFGQKAKFIDKDFGEFESRVCDVAGGRRHPQWWVENKRKILSEKNRYTLEKARSLMPEDVDIDPASYQAYHKKCWLFDKKLGKFWSSPKEVAKAGKSLHPKNKQEYRFDPETARAARDRLIESLEKNGDSLLEHNRRAQKKAAVKMLEKYGSECPFAVPEIRKRSAESCMQKYGQNYYPVGSIQESSGEREIKAWLKEEGVVAEKKQDEAFELDLFIPERNIGIEFNGVYWHSDQFKHKSYHAAKSAFFFKKGIRVVHVFECFWINRKTQVQNFLRSATGLNKEIFWARKCEFKEIPWEDSRVFCEKNHIQGSSAAINFSLGVFYRDRLVGVAQFGKGHRQGNSSEHFLKRMCFEPGVTVAGAMSKIAKIATRYYEDDIFSFVDLSISQGQGYEKSGWERVHITKPDYFYSDQNAKYISKQSRKKSVVGTPKNMTESEHAKIDKLFRIWDCGKIKMRFRYKKTPA